MKKLIVNNFGKIKHAEIELNKMMLFVGDNNSGKSYLASLIYGLHKLFDSFSFWGTFKIDEDDELFNLVKTKVSNSTCENLEGHLEFRLDSENDFTMIETSLNNFLNLNKKFIINNIFKHDIEIDNFKIKISTSEQFGIITTIGNYADVKHACFVNIKNTMTHKNPNTITNKIDDEKLFTERLCYLVMQNIFSSIFNQRTAFLPVSRTGFMLVHQDLVTNALSNRYDNIPNSSENVQKNELTKPTSDFLTTISAIRPNNTNTELDDIVEYIEKNVISGKINVSDTPTPNYTYIPNGSDKDLPMHVTSGVVTEMTPLLLYLKYVKFNTLILEEPEMCLHPKLQWSLIRALIKATHKDKNFILTTHSEAIVQHINDMIKLNRHPNKKELQNEFNYDDDDLISENDVNIYQFIVDENDKTNVEKIQYSDDGFVVSSFIDNLKERLEESFAFEDEE